MHAFVQDRASWEADLKLVAELGSLQVQNVRVEASALRLNAQLKEFRERQEQAALKNKRARQERVATLGRWLLRECLGPCVQAWRARSASPSLKERQGLAVALLRSGLPSSGISALHLVSRHTGKSRADIKEGGLEVCFEWLLWRSAVLHGRMKRAAEKSEEQVLQLNLMVVTRQQRLRRIPHTVRRLLTQAAWACCHSCLVSWRQEVRISQSEARNIPDEHRLALRRDRCCKLEALLHRAVKTQDSFRTLLLAWRTAVCADVCVQRRDLHLASCEEAKRETAASARREAAAMKMLRRECDVQVELLQLACWQTWRRLAFRCRLKVWRQRGEVALAAQREEQEQRIGELLTALFAARSGLAEARCRAEAQQLLRLAFLGLCLHFRSDAAHRALAAKESASEAHLQELWELFESRPRQHLERLSSRSFMLEFHSILTTSFLRWRRKSANAWRSICKVNLLLCVRHAQLLRSCLAAFQAEVSAARLQTRSERLSRLKWCEGPPEAPQDSWWLQMPLRIIKEGKHTCSAESSALDADGFGFAACEDSAVIDEDRCDSHRTDSQYSAVLVTP